MPQAFASPLGGLAQGFQTGFNMARAKAQDKMQEDMLNIKISLGALSNPNLPDKTKLNIYNNMYAESMGRLAPKMQISKLTEWPKGQESFYKRAMNLSDDTTLTLNDTIQGLIGLQEEASEAGSKIDLGDRLKSLRAKQERQVRAPVAAEALGRGVTTEAEAQLFTQTGKVAPKEFQADTAEIKTLENILANRVGAGTMTLEAAFKMKRRGVGDAKLTSDQIMKKKLDVTKGIATLGKSDVMEEFLAAELGVSTGSVPQELKDNYMDQANAYLDYLDSLLPENLRGDKVETKTEVDKQAEIETKEAIPVKPIGMHQGKIVYEFSDGSRRVKD